MGPLDRLLSDDLTRLTDRISAAAPPGLPRAVTEDRPDLAARIQDVEARLAGLRVDLIEGYERWRAALDEAEGLWGLATLWSEELASERRRRAA
jgi:hypothetical protein